MRNNSGRKLSSRDAIERVYRIRESVASARPFSASLLAYGERFTYSEGVLCYVTGPLVRVLDTYNSSEVEQVIDVLGIYDELALRTNPPLVQPPTETRITSISYSERVLVCVCEAETTNEAWVVVIDLGLQDPMDSCGKRAKIRSQFRHRLSCTTKLFIRHNRSYLYYATHSGLRPDGHYEWLLTGLNLESGRPITTQPFRLADFVGSDIGSTACFDIHDGFLYAVSNQTSFEVEEVDWTSYYHCIKIPLGEEKPDLEAHPIWQRQHGEGPINDSWTDLSLQKDEQTNELLIVECRKEWLGGGSANIRTYYTQPLRFNKDDEAMQMRNFPENDPLTRTLDEKSNPHFTKPRKRIRRHFHREYEHSHLDPGNPASQDFILAKTRFRAYNASVMSFVDLVCDPAPIPGSLRTRDRLRLRVASRKQKSPLVDDPSCPGHMLLRKPELNENDAPLEGSEDDFNPTGFHLWPADDAPTQIYDVLCPSGRAGSIEAISDERSIIYAISPPNGIARIVRAIVMISFDPSWDHEDFKRLFIPPPSSPVETAKEVKLELPTDFASQKTPKCSSPGPDTTPATDLRLLKRQKCQGDETRSSQNGRKQLMWSEKAMYLSINRGYRLRR